jgi:DNA damage-inducible protein 1
MAQASAAHDPFDVDAQKKIEDKIRRQNIQGNMESALEHHPESFGRVVMLYIKCEVNGHPVDAFVDSGAQATIMSPDCANTCNITHLVDERFAGIAQGVGTAKILGRVHSAQIKIGATFLPCSFTIMEGKGVDLLFGLDMLKRHQACIDLKDNVLRIAGQNVPFLSEHELTLKARGEGQSPETSKPTTDSSSKPTGSTTPTIANSSSSSSSKYPNEKIKTLTDLGFSREEAIGALDACNGDAEAAANMLF